MSSCWRCGNPTTEPFCSSCIAYQVQKEQRKIACGIALVGLFIMGLLMLAVIW